MVLASAGPYSIYEHLVARRQPCQQRITPDALLFVYVCSCQTSRRVAPSDVRLPPSPPTTDVQFHEGDDVEVVIISYRSGIYSVPVIQTIK